MKLTDFFTSDKQITDTSAKTQTSSVQNTASVNRQIHSLVPGQTIQGEVVARNGSEVRIKISEDFTLKARVDQNMNLEIGKNMTFEIKNNGQALTLSPLFANVAADANVLKALDMASLPVNSSTVEMTELLMKAGLPIDRNSLQQVFRESNQYTNANLADIVDLHKLGMPVNEGNLTQIASYKNLTHQLITGLNNCVEGLPDTIQNMLQSGDFDGAAKLYQELMNMLPEGSTLVQTGDGQLLALTPPIDGQQILQFAGDGQQLQNLLQGGDGQLLQALGGDDQLLQLLQNGSGQGLDTQTLQTLLQGMDAQSLQALSSDSQLLQLLQNGDLQGLDAQGLQTLLQGMDAQSLQALGGDVQAVLQNGDGRVLQGMVQNDASLLNTLQNLNGQNAQVSGEQLLQLLVNGQNGKLAVQLQKLPDFLKDSLQKLWTLKPEEVADPEQVEQLYNRLDKQVKGLAQVLENVNQTGSQAYRATANLSQNLDFLQQLNQAYTFVQLPLRLQQGSNAHGELYVYSNKKHLAAKDGQISALLHLDMEHLGPLDVYVAMQYEKVNTKFYVQDEEMLDFLGEHMELLTKRLKARGYDCNCEMQTRATEADGSQPTGGIRQILQESGHIPMVQYAFDVRT